MFYFTGTGNSLYVAKRLEKEPVSIPQMMKKEKFKFEADTIGIVAPIYGHELPAMVKDFMRKASFHTDYFYIILTYGNRHGGAAELAADFCRECGIVPGYINVLLMADNWLPAFDMEEQRAADKGTEGHLEEIIADITCRRQMVSEVTEADRDVHRQFVRNMEKLPDDAWKNMVRVLLGCIGCGICEKVCPSASIRVENGKAVHMPENCQTCLACVHICSHKGIGMSVPEKNPDARYRNEHVGLEEIIRANDQN